MNKEGKKRKGGDKMKENEWREEAELGEDILQLAARVYEGLSDEEIKEIEDIALDRTMTGRYEENCRKMLVAGLEFLDENHELKPEWEDSNGIIFGPVEAKNNDARRLEEVMVNACDDTPTTAMVHAVIKSLIWIRKHGWDKYVEKKKEWGRNKECEG